MTNFTLAVNYCFDDDEGPILYKFIYYPNDVTYQTDVSEATFLNSKLLRNFEENA